jgi:hypothetical protein
MNMRQRIYEETAAGECGHQPFDFGGCYEIAS